MGENEYKTPELTLGVLLTGTVSSATTPSAA